MAAFSAGVQDTCQKSLHSQTEAPSLGGHFGSYSGMPIALPLLCFSHSDADFQYFTYVPVVGLVNVHLMIVAA